MRKFRPVLFTVSTVSVVAIGIAAIILFRVKESSAPKAFRSLQSVKAKMQRPSLDRSAIAKALGNTRITSNHLKLESFPVSVSGKTYNVKFTLDRNLQERIEELYHRYSPSYAAFVAMDPETGKILAMVDYSNDPRSENLALKATYPAASVFKVVTSAAALDEKKIKPRSMLPVTGSYTTLYKSNLRDQITRWTRYISIEEAFAKSVNTVFGKIAMRRVGPEALQKYADAFAFNQHIDFDLPIEMGSAVIPKNDEFGLAESGSGYTRRQTLNPVQGAMIAAAVINQGKIPSPYMVEEVNTEQGVQVYEANQRTLSLPIDKDSAQSLSMIMEHTITHGTARKEYRDYNHHPVLSKLFIGAKTGSLSGDNPVGKYDWFVGFAQSSVNPKNKIVFASMIVNQRYWKVKSSRIAREAIIEYFSHNGQEI